MGQEIAQGAIIPVGAVPGILTGSELTKLDVGFGEYNRTIDERIAAVKAQCGVQ